MPYSTFRLTTFFTAHSVHRRDFNPNEVQLSTLLSIKTGWCPEDCKYCAQSSHFKTQVQASRTLSVVRVHREAEKAKIAGATQFCMGAGWWNLHERDLGKITEMVREVKALGLETCMTLEMLTESQAAAWKDTGLDYYNHNVDTSPEYYDQVILTRTFQDRQDTLAVVRDAGLKVCCGGIIGMGESSEDRIGMLETLVNLLPPPESVPINMLVAIPGTPLGDVEPIPPLEMVRTVAVARILVPKSHVRLSAGRRKMPDETQVLCYFAGANSVFYGEKLLTTDNPDLGRDKALFDELDLTAEPADDYSE